jgi:Fungal Zn(2)-Cys(6) binuclear cluster domain
MLVLSPSQSGALHRNHDAVANGSQVRCDGSPADGPCSNCQRYFMECIFEPVNSQRITHRIGLSTLADYGESGRLLGPCISAGARITHAPLGELAVPSAAGPESPDTLAPILYPQLPSRSVHLPSIWQILGLHTPPEAPLVSRSDGSVESAPTTWLRSFKIIQGDDVSHQGTDERDFG